MLKLNIQTNIVNISSLDKYIYDVIIDRDFSIFMSQLKCQTL